MALTFMISLVLGLYLAVLLGIAFYGLHRFKMLRLYWRASRQPEVRPRELADGEFSRVCVQCPLFNEPLVVEALLEHVTALKWPE